MNNLTLKVPSVLLAVLILFSSCASTTLIKSEPGIAKVYLDGEKVGTTPYYMRDTKIVGSRTSVKLTKEGYEEFNVDIFRNEETDAGAIVGGLFFLFPFLWTMKYKPEHTYELVPITTKEEQNTSASTSGEKSMADKLIEMKSLLDNGVITQEEFEIQKKKILAE